MGLELIITKDDLELVNLELEFRSDLPCPANGFNFFFLVLFIVAIFVCVCVCVYEWRHTRVMAHVWNLEDIFGSKFSPFTLASGAQTQIIRLVQRAP